MALSTQQLTALKTAINAVPEWAALPNIADTAYDISAALDVPSNPAVIVWRSSVSQDEIMQNGFDWTRVDNLTVGKARIWEWVFNNSSRTFNPSKLNVRAGIDSVWVGTAADLAVRAAVYIHCKRTATKAEAIFASGSGTDVSPSTMGFEGKLSYTDVMLARAS